MGKGEKNDLHNNIKVLKNLLLRRINEIVRRGVHHSPLHGIATENKDGEAELLPGIEVSASRLNVRPTNADYCLM